MTWRPAWVTTVTGGAPCRPCRSTSQPARARTPWRAAASAVKLAIVAPVTNPTLVPAGKAEQVHEPAPRRPPRRRRRQATARTTPRSGPRRSSASRHRGGRQAAPDDEAEVARTGARDEPGSAAVARSSTTVDRVGRIRPAAASRPSRPAAQRGRPAAPTGRVASDVEVGGGELGGSMRGVGSSSVMSGLLRGPRPWHATVRAD